MAGEGRRFVVLDRDGTLIESHHYLSDPDDVRLLPLVGMGLRRLRALDLGLIVITNQSAIGRGLFNEDRLAEIHRRLGDLLAEEGIELDGLYHCPHLPEDRCACRKPRSGLLELAAQEHGFTPGDSFVIGDNVCDVDLGRACGARTLLVRSGYGPQVIDDGSASPDHLVDDLVAAARVIRGILCGTGSPHP